MAWTRAAPALVAAAAVAALALSGGSSSDPRTPAAMPGLPAPFLSAAVLGGGGLSAGIDAYGDIVDLRAGPAGPPLIENPAARQAAGTVAADTGIVPRVSVGGGPWLPLWRADSVRQSYRPGTSVLRTVARFGAATTSIECAAAADRLGCLSGGTGPAPVRVSLGPRPLAAGRFIDLDGRDARRIVRAESAAARRWLAVAHPLGDPAPAWAKRLYERSLLVLRALTDRRSGAVAAGPRDGWAYVWPRDAGSVAIALAASGYRFEARRVARFLLGLDLAAAARFHGDGSPVPGRDAQGDAAGWVTAAARAAGLPGRPPPLPWRDRADYREGASGDYLGNAISAGAAPPAAALDSAAAWAVRPFRQPAFFGAAHRTLSRLAREGGRFGIVPAADWPERDPWTAPTAWSAWSLAALGDRRGALSLLAGLRRAATPSGLLPERVDFTSGVPRSTTPLAWSHAFAILALRQLWP